MITTIFFSAANVHPASAQATSLLLVVPDSNTIQTQASGTTFNLNVSVANLTLLAGLQFTLNWTYGVSCTTLTENLFATVTPPADTDNIWKIQFKKDNVAMNVLYGLTYQDMGAAEDAGYAPINITAPTYPNGELAAAMMTFNVTSIPASGSYTDVNFTITVAKAGDVSGTALPISVENATVRLMGPPLVQTLSQPVAGTSYNITTVTNETVIDNSATFTGTPMPTLSFNVTGPDGDTAYINVTIPLALMNGTAITDWTVKVNGTVVTPTITSDATNTYVYLTAPLSTEVVTMTVPEFALLLIPLLMATTLIAVALRRRRIL
jgi:hypothetical protein